MLSSNKLTLLHSVRGFAAFYVVVFHAKFALWTGGRQFTTEYPRNEWDVLDYLLFAIDMLSANGTAMVIVFFVLSGFFIAYSFDKNKWELKQFYINRLIRIYVPFLFSLLFSVLVLYVVNHINPILATLNVDRQFNNELVAGFENLNFLNFFKTLVFLPTGENQYIGFNMVYWSLLYEAIFYLLIPLVIHRLKGYLVISCVTCLASLFISHESPVLTYFLRYSIFFAVGLSFFGFLKSKPNWRPLTPFICILIIVSLFLSVVFLSLIDWMQVSHLIAGVLSLFTIFFLVNYDVKPNLFIAFFKSIGKISYTLYLFHFPILILLYAILTRITGVYLFYDRVYWLGVITAVALSYPLYQLVEDKSLRLISKLKREQKLTTALK